jgi:tyrosine-protein phosphatase YwqE
MFSFFKEKKIPVDLSFIGADMHSHLLPGIDDGLKEPEETIAYVKELKELGYEKLICTPHILAELYPNSPSIILSKLDLIKDELLKAGVDMPFEAAAEYMVDEVFEKKIEEDEHLLVFGKDKKLILIEMSYLAESPNIQRVIFQLKVKGLQPILAHPERYGFYFGNIEKYERFIDLGCLLQVNLLSLAGYYGKPVKTTAEKLLANKMISLAGTDMHHERHLQALKDFASQKKFYKLLEAANLRNRELLL